jgi:hypothetical protein
VHPDSSDGEADEVSGAVDVAEGGVEDGERDARQSVSPEAPQCGAGSEGGDRAKAAQDADERDGGPSLLRQPSPGLQPSP